MCLPRPKRHQDLGLREREPEQRPSVGLRFLLETLGHPEGLGVVKTACEAHSKASDNYEFWKEPSRLSRKPSTNYSLTNVQLSILQTTLSTQLTS